VDQASQLGEVRQVYRANVHTTYGRVGADVRAHPVGLFLTDEGALGCWKYPILLSPARNECGDAPGDFLPYIAGLQDLRVRPILQHVTHTPLHVE
jgi:hypothetical protein